MKKPLTASLSLLAACGVMLNSGCGEQARTVEAADGVTVLIAGSRSGGSEQRIVGTLREINGCLGLELNEQNRWIAVFPEGSEVAGDGLSVTLSNGSELGVGDFIEAGGDTYERGHALENAPDVPEKCGDLSAALLTDPHVTKEGES